MKPFIIGIAGLSGSGKTSLARRVAESLPGKCEIVTLDSYYHPQAHLPLEERAHLNFDHPAALDWDLLREHLDALMNGNPIEEPIYEFSEHTRAMESRRVEPAPFLILEGILALHHPLIRERMDLRVFVRTDARRCLRRRVRRDTLERGRTEESVRQQYSATVWPMAKRYVLPTQKNADVTVSGEMPFEMSVGAVLNAVAVRPVAAVAGD